MIPKDRCCPWFVNYKSHMVLGGTNAELHIFCSFYLEGVQFECKTKNISCLLIL